MVLSHLEADWVGQRRMRREEAYGPRVIRHE